MIASRVPRMKIILAVTLLSFAAAADQKVELKNAKGESVGTVTLSPASPGVTLALDLHGLAPGQHGIHFHETAKCDAPDFKSAGGHLNPAHKEHGLKNPAGAHEGDMPNLEADKDGNVKQSVTAPGATMADLAKGAAIVVHAKADDQTTNPSGASGDRVACGVLAAQ
jgi:superoxide dismutase, Cu-Zn family